MGGQEEETHKSGPCWYLGLGASGPQNQVTKCILALQDEPGGPHFVPPGSGPISHSSGVGGCRAVAEKSRHPHQCRGSCGWSWKELVTLLRSCFPACCGDRGARGTPRGNVQMPHEATEGSWELDWEVPG